VHHHDTRHIVNPSLSCPRPLFSRMPLHSTPLESWIFTFYCAHELLSLFRERKRNKEFPLGSFATRPAPFRRSLHALWTRAYYISNFHPNRHDAVTLCRAPCLRQAENNPRESFPSVYASFVWIGAQEEIHDEYFSQRFLVIIGNDANYFIVYLIAK
jgi:hypothetical protein